MLKLTLEECMALMGPEVHDEIKQSLEKYQSTGLIVFENHDLSSRYVGHLFAIGYGPNNTIKEVPEDRKCRVQPPEGHAWQYYVRAYC